MAEETTNKDEYLHDDFTFSSLQEKFIMEQDKKKKGKGNQNSEEK